MGKLEKQLEELVGFVGSGGGFGSPDAVEQHQREIDLVKFKIKRRDSFKIAIVSATIGALLGAAITAGGQIFI